MPSPDRPPLGDEAQLFESFNPTLLYVIGRDVRTSSHVVEDACAFAWMQFLKHQPDRRREWKAWLVVTARREAWRLSRERNRTVRLDVRPDASAAGREFPDTHDPHDEALNLRATMDMLEELPPRLRRIAFLRGAGLRYSDIAEITGDSLSRVGVLVTRANDRIRRTLEAEIDQKRELPPRARRLRELEDGPPRWLVAEIGQIPRSKGRRESNATRTLYWRRAALAIDDYRAMTGFDDDQRALGDRPAGGAAQRAFDVATRAVEAMNARRRDSREIA
jgi:RNA polymerase sigma factor (sigma-70 family)